MGDSYTAILLSSPLGGNRILILIIKRENDTETKQNSLKNISIILYCTFLYIYTYINFILLLTTHL